MHGCVINVVANVDEIQSILPYLSHDGATTSVFLKLCFEYKSLCMSRNVYSNMVMVILKKSNETPSPMPLHSSIQIHF